MHMVHMSLASKSLSYYGNRVLVVQRRIIIEIVELASVVIVT